MNINKIFSALALFFGAAASVAEVFPLVSGVVCVFDVDLQPAMATQQTIM